MRCTRAVMNRTDETPDFGYVPLRQCHKCSPWIDLGITPVIDRIHLRIGTSGQTQTRADLGKRDRVVWRVPGPA
jgi:hypothetical protein